MSQTAASCSVSTMMCTGFHPKLDQVVLANKKWRHEILHETSNSLQQLCNFFFGTHCFDLHCRETPPIWNLADRGEKKICKHDFDPRLLPTHADTGGGRDEGLSGISHHRETIRAGRKKSEG